jgi:hypothetical protein
VYRYVPDIDASGVEIHHRVVAAQGAGIERRIRQEQRRLRIRLGISSRRARANIRHAQELRSKVRVQLGTSAGTVNRYPALHVALS